MAAIFLSLAAAAILLAAWLFPAGRAKRMLGILAAVCAVAAMGLGGGTVLLLYLSFFSALSQPQMQAVNLLLFLPAAALSLFFHRKNGLIVPRVLLPCILGGV